MSVLWPLRLILHIYYNEHKRMLQSLCRCNSPAAPAQRGTSESHDRRRGIRGYRLKRNAKRAPAGRLARINHRSASKIA